MKKTIHDSSFKSYNVKLNQHKTEIKNTIKIYQKMLHYFITIYRKEYETLKTLTNSNHYLRKMENLIHQTEKNSYVKYPFDILFPYIPSYLRRRAIMEVKGIFDSFNTNYEDFLIIHEKRKEELRKIKDKESKKYLLLSKKIDNYYDCPTFNFYPKTFPVLYKDNMSEFIKMGKNSLLEDKYIKLKLFDNHTWKYYEFKCLDKNSKNHLNQLKINEFIPLNPKLIYKKINKHKMYQLHFSFIKKDTYSLTPDDLKKIENKTYKGEINTCSIDLGIHNPFAFTLHTCRINESSNTIVEKNSGVFKKTKEFKINTITFKKIKETIKKTNEKMSSIKLRLKELYREKEIIKKQHKNSEKESKKEEKEINFYINNLAQKYLKYKKRRKRLYERINHIQTYINNEIVFQLSNILIENNIQYLFLEHLDNFIKTENYLSKEEFHYWNKGTIFSLLKNRLGLLGIRYLKINPKNTSITCPICLTYDKKYRKKQDFCCLNPLCSDVDIKKNRDINRTKNIFSKGFLKLVSKKDK